MMRCKRFVGALLAAMVILLLPSQALAAEDIDPDRAVSLTISYEENKVPLVGAEFSLYLVAAMDETGELTTTDAFSQFDVDISGKNDAAWKDLTSTLAAYALGTTPTDSGSTDSQGQLVFPTLGGQLEQGLYLILGSPHTQDDMVYDALPFLVLMPSFDKAANAWEYSMTASPKHEFHQKPADEDTVSRRVLKVWKDAGYEAYRPQSVIIQLLQDGKVFDTVTLSDTNGWGYTWEKLEAKHTWSVIELVPAGYTVQITQEGITSVVTNTYPTDESSGPDIPDVTKLPQTGQLWWPVPLLLSLGLLFIVAGLLTRRRSRYEK